MVKYRWAYCAVFALASVATAALAYAPYLPRLLWEGYPAPLWPAFGSFAEIEGGSGVPLQANARRSALNVRLATLFEEAEGRALLVAKSGRIVMEHYAEGVSSETRFNSYSLVKSLIGALALKAIAERRIHARDVALEMLLPELSGSATGELPLCRVLDMRSGIVFENDRKKQTAGLDPKDLEATKYNLFGPMARLHTQGLASVEMQLAVERLPVSTSQQACNEGTYNYQNLNTALAGEVLERVYGKPLQAILSEKIWAPAGAAPAHWRRYDSDLPVTPYCCIYARAMDWLLVAQYLLDNGKPGVPFLPEPLWRELVGLDIPASVLHNGHYANFAYHNVLDRGGEQLQGPFTYFFGSRGQAVYLMPKQSLAVVRFGNRPQLLHSTLYEIGRSISAN